MSNNNTSNKVSILKQYLIDHGISENRFAEISGVPQSTIWRECNVMNYQMPVESAKKIEKATNKEVRAVVLLNLEA